MWMYKCIYNLHITCIHFVSIVNIAHFTRPILKLRASHCSRIFMNMKPTHTHTHIFSVFIFVVAFSLFFIVAIIQPTQREKTQKTLTCTSIFQPTKCHRGVHETKQNRGERQQQGQEKKLTNISAFLWPRCYPLCVCCFFPRFSPSPPLSHSVCLFKVKIYKSFVFVVKTNTHRRSTCKYTILFVLCVAVCV